MVSGPTKKNIVAPRKTMKNMKIPIENSPRRHFPLLYFLEEDLIEPAKPATPKSKKTIEEIYSPISEALTAD